MKKNHVNQIILLILVVLTFTFSGNAQVLVSNSSGTPDGSAILEVRSVTQGLLIPRMTTAQRNTLAATAAEGLLVYDTDVEAFYLRGNGAWIDLSSSAEIWSQNATDVYLSDDSKNVGVGTNTPSGKFVIKADASKADDDVLFEIQDNSGATIMEVTSVGVRMYVENPTSKGKGISGGFAVGKYGAAKGTGDLLVVNSGSTNVYTDDDAVKGISGGFAVGKYGAAKEKGLGDLFVVTPDSTRIYTDAATGISGGFAVGKYGAAKGSAGIYMHMTKENYFIGHQAGLNTVPGITPVGRFNLFFGYESALKNITGYQNTYVGHNTGHENIGGFRNVFLGMGSGYSNQHGKYNLFAGYQSGYNNLGIINNDSAGSKNVFLGYHAGYNNENGAENVMVGFNAGEKNTSGGNNVCLGSETGYRNQHNSDNIFIGKQAGYNHTGTGVANEANNNIYIGYRAGYGADTGEKGFDNVFIGDSAGCSNEDGYYNTFVGFKSGSSNIGGNAEEGKFNSFYGCKTGMTNTTGYYNTFVGQTAGVMNTTGNRNSFFGNNAGFLNSEGFRNTYIGNAAGYRSTTGDDNTSIGTYSGYRNSTGVGNLFIGYAAGYYETTSDKFYISNEPGSNLTDGREKALLYGNFNTDILNINATLTFNIPANSVTLPTGRGTNGQVLITDGTGNTSWSSTANLDDDWTVSGNDMYSAVSGNVGIGINSPLHKLHLLESNSNTTGTDGNFIDIENSNTTAHVMSGLRLKNGSSTNTFKGAIFYYDEETYGRGDIVFANNNDVDNTTTVSYADLRMIIKSDGDIGIGTTTPNATLDVNGSVSVNIESKSSAYTITDTDGVYTLTVSGTTTITLPTVADNEGRMIIIQRTGSGIVTIDGEGAELINNSQTVTLSVVYNAYTLQSDGSRWRIIGKVD